MHQSHNLIILEVKNKKFRPMSRHGLKSGNRSGLINSFGDRLGRLKKVIYFSIFFTSTQIISISFIIDVVLVEATCFCLDFKTRTVRILSFDDIASNFAKICS